MSLLIFRRWYRRLPTFAQLLAQFRHELFVLRQIRDVHIFVGIFFVIVKLDAAAKCLIGASWVLLLLSVIAGVWTLLALTGSLAQTSAPTAQSIFGLNVRIPAILQILLFLGGLILTVWFGVRGVGHN